MTTVFEIKAAIDKLSPAERIELDKLIANIHARNSSVDAATSALADLAALARETSTPNWDGYHAAPVSAPTITAAENFIRALPAGTPAPSVAAEPDGHVSLEWYETPQQVLSVSVAPDGFLHFAAKIGQRKINGTEPVSTEIPPTILALVHQVQRPPQRGAA